jgi:hypothetical protein
MNGSNGAWSKECVCLTITSHDGHTVIHIYHDGQKLVSSDESKIYDVDYHDNQHPPYVEFKTNLEGGFTVDADNSAQNATYDGTPDGGSHTVIDMQFTEKMCYMVCEENSIDLECETYEPPDGVKECEGQDVQCDEELEMRADVNAMLREHGLHTRPRPWVALDASDFEDLVHNTLKGGPVSAPPGSSPWWGNLVDSNGVSFQDQMQAVLATLGHSQQTYTAETLLSAGSPFYDNVFTAPQMTMLVDVLSSLDDPRVSIGNGESELTLVRGDKMRVIVEVQCEQHTKRWCVSLVHDRCATMQGGNDAGGGAHSDTDSESG